MNRHKSLIVRLLRRFAARWDSAPVTRRQGCLRYRVARTTTQLMSQNNTLRSQTCLRACLKMRFGVPPLGGAALKPPKGGTPNRPHRVSMVLCGVEEWRGGVKAGRNGVRPFRLPVSEYPAIRFVSTPRSSNRTCPFRASGFRSRDFRRSLTSGWRSLGPVVAIPSPGADTGARGASHSRPDSAVCHSTTDAADAVRGCPPPGKLG